MKTYRETNEVPVRGEYDVAVAGGGPAGIAAALAAGRRGCSVLLVESYGFLGGMWTMGMVSPLFDYENKGGICTEIVNMIDKAHMSQKIGPGMWIFDIEEMKLCLDRLLIGAGVHLLYHTHFCAPILEGDRIAGILVENKGGRTAYLAKVVVDCTGDGDVAARAGAPFEMGDPVAGQTQPMTMMFRMSNIDYVQDYYNYPHHSGNELIKIIDDALTRAGKTDQPLNYRRPCVLRVPGSHTALCQTTHIRGRQAIDPQDLTAAELEGRELVRDFFTLLKTMLPQFRDAQLDATGPHVGIRESRRILGEYLLTLEDITGGRCFDDGVCTVTFWVDIHQPDGVDQNAQTGAMLQPSYQIPYRCLVPQKVEQLLVAGRCISGTYEAHASYRVTGNCVAMGQAAGTAAWLSLLEDIPPRKLDGRRVAQAMQEAGAKL